MIRALTIHEVSNVVQLSPATVRRLVRANKFPAPARFSPRRPRWLASQVEAWMQTQAGVEVGGDDAGGPAAA
jgi:predicted DNA-binding transcriptional regulator AlpA